MMRRNLLALLVATGLLTSLDVAPDAAQGTAPNRPAATGSLKDRFVGTWKLASVETRNAKGEVIPPAANAGKPTGYIIYDPAGNMAVSIYPVTRKKYVGAQPTAEEAMAALTGYTAHSGTFTVHEKAQAVTHHLEGSLNAAMGAEQRRGYEFSGNRL